MEVSFLKQAEIFSFLALIFLLAVVFMEIDREKNPPVIILKDDLYKFELGKAIINEPFKKRFRDYEINRLINARKDCKCDILEVIGHTDGVPVKEANRSNLDRVVVKSYFRKSLADVIPGSNADLGLMRSIAVIQLIRAYSNDYPELKKIKYFLPYSAGQLILLDGSISPPSQSYMMNENERRRIEIRLRRKVKNKYFGT